MKLYKLSQSAMLEWSIVIINTTVHISHGQVNGSLQTETLGFSSTKEALTELNRRVEIKKTKQGYTEEVPTSIPDYPMLALQKHNLDLLPSIIYLQPKLDGMRCVATSTTMVSRRKEPIYSMPHIMDALKTLPPGIRLDGELYCHGVTFQEHLSIIKRNEFHPNCLKMIYNVFDIQDDSIPFTERFAQLVLLIPTLRSSYIEVVPAHLAAKEDACNLAKELYSNYEGAIFRDPQNFYEYNHRSSGLQKYKWTYTEECQIVGMEAATKGREQGAAIFILQFNNITVKARPAMPISIRKTLYELRHLIIGQWSRLTYDALSDTGVPLKPRCSGYSPTKEGLN